MTTRRARTALWLVAMLAMLAYVVSSLRVTTDISEFLPSEEGSVRSELVRAVASGPLAQRMVLSVEVGDELHAAEVSRRFEAEMLADAALSPLLASVEGGTSEESDEALWAVYAQRWPYLYARDAEDAANRLSSEGLEARAERLLAQLQGPMSAVLSRVAPDDPFLVLPEIFERLAASQAGSVALQDGRFVAEDGRFAILFVTTHARAFENAEQAKVLAGIDEAFARTRAGFDGPLTLEMSGVNRISIAVQAAIEDDIRRISLFSVLGLSLLLFFVFRGPRVALLSMMSLSTGVLAALSVSVLLFGRVHGVSLAFGASLIGLSIDYMVHLYCHHAEAAEGREPPETLRAIWPALTMAAGTSVIGFLVLGFSGFPGLREVAVFAVVGLGVSLLSVRWVVVHWLPATIAPTRFRSGLADALLRGLHGLRQRAWIAWGLLVAVVIVVAVGLPQLRWSDALVDMGTLDDALMAEEERVRARVSRFDQSRFIASVGADEEAALRSAEQVRDLLEREALAAGFASISALVPSQARQREVAALLRETPGLQARFDAAFSAAGFRPEQFAGMRWALEDELPPPVRPADLAGTPLATFSEGFLMPLGDRVVALTFLHGVHDSDALGQHLEGIEGAVYVDQQTMISDFGASQGGRTAIIVTLGLLAIFTLLWSRYRRVGAVIAVLVPSLLAVAFTWALLSILGETADLVIVSASLMIVSLGVDYGVFLVDSSRQEGPQLRSALLGVAVAGATTMIGFGLLALATYPLLFRIGLTAAVGVPTAMLLAPISLILFRSKEPT